MRKSKAYEWIEPLKLLAQELATKKTVIPNVDYAGLDEKSAVIVSKINALIEIIPSVYPHLKDMIPLLQLKKKILLHEGRARWISNASELTNLGLLVPKKMKVLDLSKEKKMEKNNGENEEEVVQT